MRAAVVVAHPDDETMFAGMLISRFKNWDWTVICAARNSETPRGREFVEACRVLNAKPVLLDARYGGKHGDPMEEAEVSDLLREVCDISTFDLFVTHNEIGEYGQQDHLIVHRSVLAMAPRMLWTFGFGMDHSDFVIPPSRSSSETKRNAIACYPSQNERIVLVDPCSPECFINVT